MTINRYDIIIILPSALKMKPYIGVTLAKFFFNFAYREPSAIFFLNSSFFDCKSNGPTPRLPNTIVFLKMTPKRWGQVGLFLDFFLSRTQYFFQIFLLHFFRI